MCNLSIFHYKEFSFNLPVVTTGERIFVIDTYMGPGSIKDLLAFCKEEKKDKKGYVINTHYHFDHIWGNSAFGDWEIIAHRKCLQKIKEEGEKNLTEIEKENPHRVKEKIKITLPTLIFENEITFSSPSGEDIKIKYLPGHSEDSSVVIAGKTLLAGDMVEDPFPLLEGDNIGLYIKNLKWLKKKNFSRIIPSHGKREDPQLIDDNIKYLEGLKSNVTELLRNGKNPDEENVSIKKLLTSTKNLSPFYIKSHKDNIRKILEFLGKE